MSIRKNTPNRLTLFRECHICGQRIVTTADTPFMRQMTNVNGKKQATVYFCSESCKQASYKHLFDGKAEERRKEREENRDRTEYRKNRYEKNKEAEREYQRLRYWSDPEKYRERNRYNKKKRRLLEGCQL